MPRTAPSGNSRSEREEASEESVIKNFRKSLSKSGSGGGVSLHINADIAKEFGLNEDTEVTVDVLDEDGDVTFKIKEIPAGFTHAALQEYADRQGWEETDAYVDADGNSWSLTYRDPTELVRIEIDSTTSIDGAVVNNVFIQGIPIEVDDDLELYKDLCTAAIRKDLRVRVRDSNGYWARLQGSAEHDTDGAPDEATFKQLLNAADSVTVQLVQEMASLNTSLDEISATVHNIQSVMKEYCDTPQSTT